MGVRISESVEANIMLADIQQTVEISTSGTWSKSTTNTLTAPSQNIKVPAESQIKVNYDIYQNDSIIATSLQRVVKNLDMPLTILHANNYFDPAKGGGSNVGVMHFTLDQLFNGGHLYDSLLHIPGAYIQKDDEGKLLIGAPTTFDAQGATLTVTVEPAEPIKK